MSSGAGSRESSSFSRLQVLISGDSEGDTLVPNRAVTDFGAWFSGLLAHSPAAYRRVDGHLKEFMPDFKDVKNPFSRQRFPESLRPIPARRGEW